MKIWFALLFLRQNTYLMMDFLGKRKKVSPLQFCCMAAVVILFFISLLGCSNSEEIPDVSSVKVSLDTRRLDLDLAKIDTNHISIGVQQLYQKYPDFLNFYLDTLMGFDIKGNYSDTAKGMQLGLKTFLTFKDYRGLFDSVAAHYPDTKEIDNRLTQGFQFMKHYFPKYEIPKIIYLVSGLHNWGAFTYESNKVGIGLDMFLGASYPFYNSVGLPEYLTTHRQAVYIPVAVFSTIYQDTHPFVPDNRSLLDMMIQKGKEQYFLTKIIPHTPDSVRLGYTSNQMDWCNANEVMVYNFFISQQLLYSKDGQKIYRYVFDGPTSVGMPAQSPGNIGTWMGLQIVKSYVQTHPSVTLQQLIEQHIDAQNFLQESKYKPR